jgi:hypothetical protein
MSKDWRTQLWTGKRQSNPYSVLEEGYYTPREKSRPPTMTTTTKIAGISHQTWYPTAMSDETTKGATVKSIAGYLTKSKDGHLVMKPVEEPTKVDLITFKTNVGTALLKCRSTNEGGHDKDLVEGNREKLLYRMARLDHKAGQKVLTTIGTHSKGTLTHGATRH